MAKPVPQQQPAQPGIRAAQSATPVHIEIDLDDAIAAFVKNRLRFQEQWVGKQVKVRISSVQQVGDIPNSTCAYAICTVPPPRNTPEAGMVNCAFGRDHRQQLLSLNVPQRIDTYVCGTIVGTLVNEQVGSLYDLAIGDCHFELIKR